MVAFSIGPFTVYRYGIMYLISFLVGYFRLRHIGKILKKNFIGLHSNSSDFIIEILTTKLDDFVLAIIIGGLLGGRFGEVLIYQLPYYLSHPTEILAVRNGGMSFIGGILGALIAILIFLKRQKINIRPQTFLPLLDHIVPIVPFGIAMGRIGNFLNQELYGHIVPANARNIAPSIVECLQRLHIFHIYHNISPELRINTNFLAIFFEGFLLLLILQILYHRKYKHGKLKAGTLPALFLILYALFRFFLEFLRVDSTTYLRGPLSASQRIFILFFILGSAFLIHQKKSFPSSPK